MADLSRPGPTWPDEDAGRGQIILLTGFLLAVLLVALALITNSAIYTENLATRSESSRAGEALEYRDSVERTAYDVLRYANEVNSTTADSHGDVRTNFSVAINESSDLSERQIARQGHLANYSVESMTNGWHIEDGSTGDFTDTSSNQDWDVATSVEETRGFRIHVEDHNQLTDKDNNPSADEFQLIVEAGSDVWYLNISRNAAGESVVGVIDDTGAYDTETVPSGSFWLNVTEGTVDGSDWDHMTFGEGVGSPYSIEYENASAIDGTYELEVSEASAGPAPVARPIVYKATIDFAYRTSELDYRTEIPIDPGETDD